MEDTVSFRNITHRVTEELCSSEMAGQEATSVLKRELRKRIRTTLSSLNRNQILSESNYLTRSLLGHTSYQNAKTIALYASLPTEIDTSTLIKDALTSEKRVFLPRVISKASRSMAMLEVKSVEDLDSFDRGAYSIPEPPLNDGRARAPTDVDLDLIVVPGVAFDEAGHRLGQGMGYYDVFLQHCKKRVDDGIENSQMPKLIALAMSVQMVSHVPVDDLDWIIDEVISAPASLHSEGY